MVKWYEEYPNRNLFLLWNLYIYCKIHFISVLNLPWTRIIHCKTWHSFKNFYTGCKMNLLFVAVVLLISKSPRLHLAYDISPGVFICAILVDFTVTLHCRWLRNSKVTFIFIDIFCFVQSLSSKIPTLYRGHRRSRWIEHGIQLVPTWSMFLLLNLSFAEESLSCDEAFCSQKLKLTFPTRFLFRYSSSSVLLRWFSSITTVWCKRVGEAGVDRPEVERLSSENYNENVKPLLISPFSRFSLTGVVLRKLFNVR